MKPTSLVACIALCLAACNLPTPVGTLSDATLSLSSSTWGCDGPRTVSLELLPNSSDYGAIDATATLDGVTLTQVESGECPTGFEVGGSIHRCTPPMWILDSELLAPEPGHVSKIVVSDGTGHLEMEVRDLFAKREVKVVSGSIASGSASLDWSPATDAASEPGLWRDTDWTTPSGYTSGTVSAATHTIDYATLPEGACAGELLETRWTVSLAVPSCGALRCEAKVQACQRVALP